MTPQYSLRVVLYAEGPGETLGAVPCSGPPGSPLNEEMLGPGHILIKRLIQDRIFPELELVVKFEAPLKDKKGRSVKGSMLHHRQTLRQIVTWPNSNMQPDVTVILADQDGDASREKTLEEFISDRSSNPVIGIAVREFEAWLLGDQNAVRRVIDVHFDPLKSVERMSPREAKECLGNLIGVSEVELGADEIRREIAYSCDLGVLSKECSSFNSFEQKLKIRALTCGL